MQLGATKVSTSANSIPDWAEEAAAELESAKATNPWGNNDLMDVNADDDDWSGRGRDKERVTSQRGRAWSGDRASRVRSSTCTVYFIFIIKQLLHVQSKVTNPA